MNKFIVDVGATVDELGAIRINGIRFVPAKQSVIDELRGNGDYGRYIRAIQEEVKKEVKTVGRQAVRVSNELINQILESS